MMLLFKLNLQLFAEDGEADDKPKDKTDPNVGLLLEKVKKLEEKIEAQDKQIASVTEFNRRLLDGAKPVDSGSGNDKNSKFEAYMKE